MQFLCTYLQQCVSQVRTCRREVVSSQEARFQREARGEAVRKDKCKDTAVHSILLVRNVANMRLLPLAIVRHSRQHRVTSRLFCCLSADEVYQGLTELSAVTLRQHRIDP